MYYIFICVYIIYNGLMIIVWNNHVYTSIQCHAHIHDTTRTVVGENNFETFNHISSLFPHVWLNCCSLVFDRHWNCLNRQHGSKMKPCWATPYYIRSIIKKKPNSVREIAEMTDVLLTHLERKNTTFYYRFMRQIDLLVMFVSAYHLSKHIYSVWW